MAIRVETHGRIRVIAIDRPEARCAAEGINEAWFKRMNFPEGWDDPLGEPLEGPMGPTRLMLSKPRTPLPACFAVAGGCR